MSPGVLSLFSNAALTQKLFSRHLPINLFSLVEADLIIALYNAKFQHFKTCIAFILS